MTIRRYLLGGVCLAGVVALGSVYLRYVREAEDWLDPADLARRASLSDPDWANYQEDIKAQIGAGPVAQWQGKPVSARRDGALVHVTFRLRGPWADGAAAMPVLIRFPLGSERRQESSEPRGPEMVYTFRLNGEAARAPLPWIMLKYPHHEERLTLNSLGVWEEGPVQK